MEIFEGFELDPKAFNEQTRSLRHLRPLLEKTDERSVVEALHKAWLDYLANSLRPLTSPWTSNSVWLSPGNPSRNPPLLA